jgi:hypothetical protein
VLTWPLTGRNFPLFLPEPRTKEDAALGIRPVLNPFNGPSFGRRPGPLVRRMR